MSGFCLAILSVYHHEHHQKMFFFEKGLDPIYLVHPGFYRKHPGEDKKYNKLHSIQTPGV